MLTFKDLPVGMLFWYQPAGDAFTKLDEKYAQQSDAPTGKTPFNPDDVVEEY